MGGAKECAYLLILYLELVAEPVDKVPDHKQRRRDPHRPGVDIVHQLRLGAVQAVLLALGTDVADIIYILSNHSHLQVTRPLEGSVDDALPLPLQVVCRHHHTLFLWSICDSFQFPQWNTSRLQNHENCSVL